MDYRKNNKKIKYNLIEMLKNKWNGIKIAKINNLRINQLEANQIIGKKFEIRAG